MKKVSLDLKKNVNDSYEVEIERGLLRRLASDLRMRRFADQYVLLSDSKVNRFYSHDLVSSLKREDLFFGKIVVPMGEKSKSFFQFQQVLKKMLSFGANRKTGLIALGGGVVGDLGGFVASSFMRGIPYIQIPTSLLAMVDSSVGGKVAIDLNEGKNLIGAFWQPKKVYIDPDVLKTLPKKHWKSGLGEAVKYGAIKDRHLWDFFEQNIDLWNKKPTEFLLSDFQIIEEMIERCVRIKAEVVMQDEKEDNLRQILNYGHTFGHVIELMSGYTVLHGEAVATGMRMAATLSERLRIMPAKEKKKQDVLFDALSIGKTKINGLVSEFVRYMKKDKKSIGDIKTVLVARLGYCYQQLGHYGISVSDKMIRKVLLDSGFIDNKKPVVKNVSSLSSHTSSGSFPQSSVSSHSYPSNDSHLCSSSDYSSEETDLQKRLRLMRERRIQQQRDGSESGGLGNGGFLPG